MNKGFTREDKERMTYLVKNNQRSYKYVADRYDISVEEVRNIVNEIYYEDDEDEEEYEPKVVTYENDGEETVISFGLIGDTHMNSIYSQLTNLHDFYDKLAERGIDTVYHTGDIDEGDQMRQGHQYECYTQGVDAHVKEIVKNYPRRDGITTYFITGNHDFSIFKRSGIDIGMMIEKERNDMVYLGRDISTVELSPNCTMQLRHPYDGGASSVSCKVQRLVDEMVYDRPSILAVGNYHKIEQLFYKGVHIFQTGAFQGQTHFTKGKNLRVDMGGWIITVTIDKSGYIKSIVSELIPYTIDRKDDWENWR